MINHAIGDAGLHRIIAETQATNARSCRLLEGLGFVELKKVQRFGAVQTIYTIKQSAREVP